MATRDILQIGHPTLRQKARKLDRQEVNAPETQALVDDIIETMRYAKGAGLAAPQIGESVQICAVEVADNPRYPYKPKIPLTILINPVLTPIGQETFENYEGCLSVPNLRGRVQRYKQIEVNALDRYGNSIDFVASGLEAGTYQHEVDHLFGRLFVDLVSDPTSLSTWDNYKSHHEETFLKQLAQSVTLTRK